MQRSTLSFAALRIVIREQRLGTTERNTVMTKTKSSEKDKARSLEKEALLLRKLLHGWVCNKKDRLDESLKRSRKRSKEALDAWDSQEAHYAVWDVVYDLKKTLELSGGVIFNEENPLLLPDDIREKIAKLKTAAEISANKHYSAG
jgi:hypothetical protein